LDLRDLYSNEVLTAIGDTRAELKYHLNKSSGDKFDNAELLDASHPGRGKLGKMV